MVKKISRKKTSKASKAGKPGKSKSKFAFTHVVKRKGHWEPFDDRKVYAAVYSSALNCHYSDDRAEAIATKVTARVDSWVKKRSKISSHEIREAILDEIDDDDVALMYKHHLDLC